MTHAKDYLNEFSSSQPLWLKNLINEAINSNGNISEEKINDIYKLLKEDIVEVKSTEKESSDAIEAKNIVCKLILKKLTHNSGVNALKNGQSISFNKDCNVLFGLNGSGKSSYFRILNEIAGGNEKKDILSNIYLNIKEPISVDIDYLLGEDSKHLKWDNTSRAIYPFNVIRVIDSSYLNGLLNKRKVDSTLIEPFGLNLFSYIIKIIDDFNNKLSNEIQNIKNEKPNINLEKFTPQNKNFFDNDYLDIEQEKNIRDKFEFIDDKKLNDFKKQYQDISQQNIQDTIEINMIKQSIEKIAENINTYAKEAKVILELYEKYSSESNEFKKQIEVLKKIPSTDSKNWKSFIESAYAYSQEIEDSKKVCIYCRQPLQSEAIDIVKAYSIYLKNESEEELKKVDIKITNLIKKIEQINIDLQINQDIRKLFKTTLFENKSISICRVIINFYNKSKKIKENLISCLDKKEKSIESSLSCEKLLSEINILLGSIESNIEKLKSDENEKQAQLQKLSDVIAPLEEHKAISEQQEKITKWIDLDKRMQFLKNKMKYCNTKNLSDLSKKAHNELLTENLKTKFIEELQSIGFKNLKVKLENAGVSKGETETKLVLYNTEKISLILSEGEQKAVALSIFIAEVRMQTQANPIILDDPVNSLDHKIALNFAKRILELDNQIIIFTHNRLFLNSFETVSGAHICKNLNNGCNKEGKHIYLYTVQGEGKNNKGIILDNYPNKAKGHFKKAKEYLNESPFFRNLEVAIRLRRTIECLIDEKIFKDQVPTKFTSKNNRINWNGLKKLSNGNNDKLIDTLKEIHDELSSRAIHNGIETEENPISKEEFDEMVSNLDELMKEES